jgi:hypothetical protein
MRRRCGILSAIAVLCGIGLVQTSCFFSAELDDCSFYLRTDCFDGGGGPTPACIPSQNAGAVADSCGVFVSSTTGSDTAGKGTQAAPYATITAALAKGSSATIYACAGTKAYAEALAVDTKVTLFGALDCGTWAYDAAKKTQLTAPADMVPLTLSSSASGTEVDDFAITAVDATVASGSSIAVIANSVMASFERTDITASNGMAGIAGTTPTTTVGPTDPTDTSIAGTVGTPACMSTSQQFGGAPVTNPLCASTGGAGGEGFVGSGGDGQASPATPQTALGGQGQPSSDMGTWSCIVGAGTIGGNGGTGMPGTGATSSDLGTLGSTALYYTGVAGQPGGSGMPAQGGGGGGGAKGQTMCAGASGGSGGAGGCGGNGGGGGQPGGASLGVVSLGATLAFDTVTITVGTGGTGGDGAAGEGGGIGGKGGSGGIGAPNPTSTLAACDGGNGGQGGKGGQGGGGRGGHAIGIAYTGTTAPSTKGVTFSNQGTPGMGGTGGNSTGNGAAGVAANTQGF